MLQIRNVSKKYRGATVNAVQNLDLEVKKGEIFGFLGPNGAGKTTTIKMIVGLLAPDQGEVVVNGHNVVRQPLQAKASLGFVPDNPDLYQRLTGMEYLNLIGDVFQVPRNERVKRIGYYLDMFNFGHAVNDLVQSFSHGMQQKLALIGALMHPPPWFVLDEPMV